MPSVILPRRYRGRTTKPGRGNQAQLNHRHPLARGLVGCWVLNEGGDTLPVDLVSGHKSSASTNVAWADDSNGVHLDFTSTLPHIDLNHRGLDTVFPPCCIMILCDLDVVGTMFPITTNDFNDGSGFYSGITFQYNTSSNEIQLHYGDGGTPSSSNRLTAAYSGLGSSGLHHWGFNFIPPDTAVNSEAFKDGVRSTITPSLSGSGAGIAYQGSEAFGKLGRNSAVNCTGQYYFAAIWNRTLSDAEHASMAANPWQLVKGSRSTTVFLMAPNEPNPGTLALAGQSVRVQVDLFPTSGVLVLAGTQPALAIGPNITPAAGKVTLVGPQPVVSSGRNIQPTPGVLTLAGVQVNLVAHAITAGTGILGLNGVQPVVANSPSLFPSTGVLTLAGSAVSLSRPFYVPTAGTLGLAGQPAQVTGATRARVSQVLVEYIGTDATSLTRQLNGHYDLGSFTHLRRQLNEEYDLPDVTPLLRQFNEQYDLPDIQNIARHLNDQYNLDAFTQLKRQLNTDYGIEIFAPLTRQFDAHYTFNAFEPFTRQLDAEHDLQVFQALQRALDAHYDLAGITPAIRQLQAEHILNAFLPAIRSLDGHYDLQAFLERQRLLDGHYDLQAFLAATRELNEQYDLPDGLGVTRQLTGEYILNAFLPAFRQLDGHYDLQTFEELRRALDAAYQLDIFDAVTRQVTAQYDLQAFVSRKRLLNEEYDLQAFLALQRQLNAHYNLDAFLPLLRQLNSEYDLPVLVEALRQLNAHYDLQAYQQSVRYLNEEYDLQVYAQLCRQLNEQYLLDAAQVIYTWLINLATNAPSRYENFPFHSLARFNAEYFAARADGIYRLDAATDRNDIKGSHTGLSNQLTQLDDSLATFQASNVKVGEVITNDTDGSAGTVVGVINETRLVTSDLTGGTDNDWDNGDAYTITHFDDIAAFADTGKLDLGTNRLKRVPAGFLGEDSDGTLRLTFTTDNGKTHGPYNIRSSSSAIKPARGKFARGIKSRFWEFKLENKDGASLRLDKVQLEVEDYPSRFK